jgi:hypothetical protein
MIPKTSLKVNESREGRVATLATGVDCECAFASFAGCEVDPAALLETGLLINHVIAHRQIMHELTNLTV